MICVVRQKNMDQVRTRFERATASVCELVFTTDQASKCSIVKRETISGVNDGDDHPSVGREVEVEHGGLTYHNRNQESCLLCYIQTDR